MLYLWSKISSFRNETVAAYCMCCGGWHTDLGKTQMWRGLLYKWWIFDHRSLKNVLKRKKKNPTTNTKKSSQANQWLKVSPPESYTPGSKLWLSKHKRLQQSNLTHVPGRSKSLKSALWVRSLHPLKNRLFLQVTTMIKTSLDHLREAEWRQWSSRHTLTKTV